jgi:hypothetical protein
MWIAMIQWYGRVVVVWGWAGAEGRASGRATCSGGALPDGAEATAALAVAAEATIVTCGWEAGRRRGRMAWTEGESGGPRRNEQSLCWTDESESVSSTDDLTVIHFGLVAIYEYVGTRKFGDVAII